MGFPAATNVSGANPGPNNAVLPDTVQMPTGNVQKVGVFNITLTPGALGAGPSVTEKTFTALGIGLLTTDVVILEYPGVQTANVAILDSRVSANDTLSTKFLATAGTPSPAAGIHVLKVIRIQPNWTAPATGNQLDW